MKKISILGCTGSIGKAALDVIEKFPGKFKVVGLAANSNIEVLEQQIKKFKPKAAAVYNEEKYHSIKKKIKNTELFFGPEGVNKVASLKEADMVVSAVVGSAGLRPTLSAISAGKHIALACKDVLVMAGDIVMDKVKKKGINLIPVDSEHSAIFQILRNWKKKDIKKIILTSSGGPFHKTPFSEFKKITLESALAHPVWKMGKKITVDSATMLNKGFEVIEAHHLFDIDYNNIEVILHPQGVIHSMVELLDGEIYAQLGVADMRFPILNALSYPDIVENEFPKLNLTKISGLNFIEPDYNKFKLLSTAYECGRNGGSLPSVLVACDDVCVESFLQNEIKFIQIPEIINRVIRSHKVINSPAIEDIFKTEKWAKEKTRDEIRKIITSKIP